VHGRANLREAEVKCLRRDRAGNGSVTATGRENTVPSGSNAYTAPVPPIAGSGSKVVVVTVSVTS
jgi:hypothetical protein